MTQTAVTAIRRLRVSGLQEPPHSTARCTEGLQMAMPKDWAARSQHKPCQGLRPGSATEDFLPLGGMNHRSTKRSGITRFKLCTGKGSAELPAHSGSRHGKPTELPPGKRLRGILWERNICIERLKTEGKRIKSRGGGRGRKRSHPRSSLPFIVITNPIKRLLACGSLYS